MLGRLADAVADRLGFEIRRPGDEPADPPSGSGVRPDPEIAEAIRQVEGATMLSEARLDTLYRQVVHCERSGIPGALVECGVWKGGAVGVMALANLRHGRRRRQLHLFDAFGDICEPDAAVDGQRAVRQVEELTSGRASAATSGALRPVEGVYDRLGGPGSVKEVRRLLVESIGYDPAFLRLHQGWFQETVPAAAADLGRIALLRLDGDWYDSVRVCLEHLYPAVASGGFIVVDDYRYYEGRTRAVDEFREEHGIEAFLHHADYGHRAHAYWVKP